jgi:hypothetical protein
MAFIPKDAKWYIGDLVVETSVDDENKEETIVQINIVLIRADSPEDAFTKAIQLGKDYEMEYKNTEGNLVKAKFLGLRDLNVIHDELKHGAELTYESKEGLSQQDIDQMVKPKELLSVFRIEDD